MCLRFLESELPEEVDAALDFENENLTDLNEMCRAIQPLNQAEREKLGAVVLFTKPEQAGQITNLAKELEQFDYVPKVRTPEEYGKYMIMDSGHYEYDENLAGYIDFAKYGKERVENEQGQFNDRGYVAYQGTLRLDELMQGDPAENMGPAAEDGVIRAKKQPKDHSFGCKCIFRVKPSALVRYCSGEMAPCSRKLFSMAI
jgi:hypothetical protein